MERRFDAYKQVVQQLLLETEEIANAVNGLGRLLEQLEWHREDDVACKEPILDNNPGVVSDIGVSLKYLGEFQNYKFQDIKQVLEDFSEEEQKDGNPCIERDIMLVSQKG